VDIQSRKIRTERKGKIKMESDIYKTKDLACASLLYASNKKLLRLERDGNSKQFYFVFSDKAQCEKLVTSYWQGEAVINAKIFSDAMRTMKDRIFSER